jgi:hypothetical protein
MTEDRSLVVPFWAPGERAKNAGPKMVKLIKRLIAAESTSMKPSEQTARISVMGQATVACTI